MVSLRSLPFFLLLSLYNPLNPLAQETDFGNEPDLDLYEIKGLPDTVPLVIAPPNDPLSEFPAPEPGTIPARPVPDGMSLVQMFYPSNPAVHIFASTNGNLYIKGPPPEGEETEAEAAGVDLSAFFLSRKGVVVGDSTQRLFHMYRPTMQSFGVSRIRLHSEERMPRGSVFVSLVPLTMSDGSSRLVGMTTDREVVYIVVCRIDKQMTKLFLVKDEEALRTLESEEMRDIVTGGDVRECHLVALTNGADGLAERP